MKISIIHSELIPYWDQDAGHHRRICQARYIQFARPIRLRTIIFRCDSQYRRVLKGSVFTSRVPGQIEILSHLDRAEKLSDGLHHLSFPAEQEPVTWIIVRVDDAGDNFWPFACTVQEIEIEGDLLCEDATAQETWHPAEPVNLMPMRGQFCRMPWAKRAWFGNPEGMVSKRAFLGWNNHLPRLYHFSIDGSVQGLFRNNLLYPHVPSTVALLEAGGISATLQDSSASISSEGDDIWYYPVYEVLPGVRVNINIRWAHDSFVIEIIRESRREWYAISPADFRLYFDGRSAIPNLYGLVNEETGAGKVIDSSLLYFCGIGCIEIIPNGENAYVRGDIDVYKKFLRVDLCAGEDGFENGLYHIKTGVKKASFLFRFVDIPYPILENSSGLEKKALARSWLSSIAYRPDTGRLGNHGLSVHCCGLLHFYAESAVMTPALTSNGRLRGLDLLRQTIDLYARGAGLYGPDDKYPVFPSSLLISLHTYFGVERDCQQFTAWRDAIMRWFNALYDYLDEQGLIVCIYPGHGPENGTAAYWDQARSGHYDTYNNILAYRAFREIAEVFCWAGEPELSEKSKKAAERLKAAFLRILYDEGTGILVGWRDRRSKLHNYWNPVINGMAIAYGLIDDPGLARDILSRILKKMAEVGFNNFKLGLPGNLMPYRKEDYNDYPWSIGRPETEDGADAMGIFVNGGASASHVAPFLQVLYKYGFQKEADIILDAMLESYSEHFFAGSMGSCVEWRAWDGSPTGYEGMLAECFHPLTVLFWRQKQNTDSINDGSNKVSFVTKT